MECSCTQKTTFSQQVWSTQSTHQRELRAGKRYSLLKKSAKSVSSLKLQTWAQVLSQSLMSTAYSPVYNPAVTPKVRHTAPLPSVEPAFHFPWLGVRRGSEHSTEQQMTQISCSWCPPLMISTNMRVVEHWKLLSGEVVELPSLEILRVRFGGADWVEDVPAHCREVRLDNL